MGHTLNWGELKEVQEKEIIEDFQPLQRKEKEMVPGVLELILGQK